MRIDLHAHTTASDGTTEPRALVAEAVTAGLDVVAITDHDTTAGWAAATEAEAALAAPRPLSLVRGMEWSCVARAEPAGTEKDGRVSVHLLCYLFDPDDPAILAETARLRGERGRRLRVMAERMAADGLPVDADELFSDTEQVPGRPHLARVLVDHGVAESMQAAFAGPLSKDSPYYERKRDTPVEDAVRAVTAAGGVTVIAHPRARSRGALMDMAQIVELAESGLAGVEADHLDHDADDRAYLRDLATGAGLVVTGSSDFHGGNKTVRLGAELTAPDQYAALVERAFGVDVVGGGSAAAQATTSGEGA
ncbi:PHP domain-containing protein [Tomitella fengzijianii]|uniref:Phosphatase n=1 Tax=Tomitella fengzijianii TaxID=2597660 RepID=A0A516X2D5_9ACTN|nr:PHP domain-containing protein [Tomitella fengzijianii]QDQ97248.1 phosphatase [Tomitella fengzijianii]